MDVYNCFTGMGIEREDAVAGDVAPLLEHIHTILCNGNQDHSQYLLNCMAHMAQFPWRRLNVCIVLIPEEGVTSTKMTRGKAVGLVAAGCVAGFAIAKAVKSF